jgi:hypothetical protein
VRRIRLVRSASASAVSCAAQRQGNRLRLRSDRNPRHPVEQFLRLRNDRQAAIRTQRLNRYAAYKTNKVVVVQVAKDRHVGATYFWATATSRI